MARKHDFQARRQQHRAGSARGVQGVARTAPTGARPEARIAGGARGVRRLMRWAAGLWLLAAAAASADPTPHEIIWAHPDGAAVRRFVVFVSPVKGDVGAARRIDVGKPQGQSGGLVEYYSALVTLDGDEFVAVAAIGQDGRMGELSSWSGPRPSRPGQPIVITP